MEQFSNRIYEDVPPQYVTKFDNAAVKNLYSLDKSKTGYSKSKVKIRPSLIARHMKTFLIFFALMSQSLYQESAFVYVCNETTAATSNNKLLCIYLIRYNFEKTNLNSLLLVC